MKKVTCYRVGLCVSFILLLLSPVLVYARGPHSISFSGSVVSFQNAHEAGLRNIAPLGSTKFAYEYRLNSDWAVQIPIPDANYSFWSPLDTPHQEGEVVQMIRYGIVPKYFFVQNARDANATRDAYIGAGPLYANISEVRPGMETDENKWGFELLVGFQFFPTFLPEKLGVAIDAQYLWFPKISTPLGNLDVSVPSIMAGFRYHFGGGLP